MTNRPRVSPLRLLPLLILATVAACGSESGGGDDPGSGGTGGEPPAGLVGHDWVSTAVTEGGADRPLVPGTTISLSFADGQVGASAGCNQLAGAADWDGATLIVDTLGGTEMACEPARMRQDEWLVGILTSRPTVDVAGDRMVLTRGDLVIDFLDREVAVPDTALEGTTWVLESIGTTGPDGAVSSVPGDVRSTLRIDGERLSVKPGCNTGGGSVEVGASTLTLGPIMTTKMACPGARDEVERAVLTVLQGTVDYHVDGESLTLTSGDSLLTYRAEHA